MDEMKQIRDILQDMGVRLNDMQWQNLRLRIVAAHPGVDEIRAALLDLAEARCCQGASHSVVLYGHGTTPVNCQDKLLVKCPMGANTATIVAAIRDLIPKPEPTWEEDWENVDAYLHYCSGVGIDPVDHPPRESVRESMDRLRNRLET